MTETVSGRVSSNICENVLLNPVCPNGCVCSHEIELCPDLCAGVQEGGSGDTFKCIALKFRAQHMLKASGSAKWGAGGECRLLLLHNLDFLHLYTCKDALPGYSPYEVIITL